MQDIILQYDEQALHVLRSELARRINYKWKCMNGSIVNVKDMTTSHLINAVSKLENYIKEKEIEQENFVDATDYYD